MGICGYSHGKTDRFPYGMGMGMTLSLWVFSHVGSVGFPVGFLEHFCGFLWVFQWVLWGFSVGFCGYSR